MAKRAPTTPNRRTFLIGDIDRSRRIVSLTASTSASIPTYMQTPENDANGDPIWREVPLSVVSWNLSRAQNGVMPIMWAHDYSKIPIAKPLEVVDGPEGLRVRIEFAQVFPLAEEIWRAVDQGLVRGVSVGFGAGEDTFTGQGDAMVCTRRNAELLEISIVPVPADAGGIVDPVIASATPAVRAEDDQDDEEESDEEREAKRRAKLSESARHLASARKREVRADAADDEIVHRFDVRTTGSRNIERLQSGGIRVKARLSRTGVLVYKRGTPDERREFRHPDEVFRADSVDTLRSAPVTDSANHLKLIGTHNWNEVARGHIENVRADGDYIAGDVIVNDARMVADVDNGRLADTSAAYSCKLKRAPGIWNGEPYEFVQSNIKYNHVAVLPPGRGRSGADVGLRFDSTDAEGVISEETDMKVIRIDGKDVEYGSEDHVKHIETAAQVRFDAVEKEGKARFDVLQARFDSLDAENKTLKKDLDTARDTTAVDKRITERAALLASSHMILGDKFRADGLSDRELRTEMMGTDETLKAVNWKERSDEYVTARYDGFVERVTTRADGIDNVVNQLREVQRADEVAASIDNPEATARAAMLKRNLENSRKPFGLQGGAK